jgi:6-phosphogluconolactonase (cycloisomerase 2 family)
MKCALLTCFALLLASTAVAQNQFVYTNDNVSTGINQNPINTVSAFQVGSTGRLTLIAGSPFRTGGAGGGNSINPEEIAVAVQGRSNFLYAANDGSGTISGFKIDPTSGFLERIPGSPFLADGPPGGDYSLTATPNGKYLYATSDSTTVIHIYEISSTGALSLVGTPVQTGATNDGLKVTANGKFLVVGENTLTAVGVYSIGSNGALTAVAGSPFPASAPPYDVEVNCGNLVFVADSGSLVDVYSMQSSGSLTRVPGEPFSNGTTSTNGGLALSPNNQFLFVTDSFSNDVSSMAVASDGALSQVPGSPFATSSWTGGVAVTHSGTFVYSALFTVAQVDGRAVDSTGKLTPVPGTPFSTGQSQTGVPTVITFPPRFCSMQ